jgi:hypothetical protein
VNLERITLGLCVLIGGLVLVPTVAVWISAAAVLGALSGSAAGPHAGAPAGFRPGPVPPSSFARGAGSGLPNLIARGGGLVPGWADRAPINQYARSSYRSDQAWSTWRDADCSAAALAWFLGAYGNRVQSLEDAIALIGPGTGISTRLGLLDARGTALARAVATRGLVPRTPGIRPLRSIVELQAWLDRGPLLMDGARWFGEGHWFVAIGYDAGGVSIRDSSGWDTRYLTWARLYGEVGFSGWVVGVDQ